MSKEITPRRREQRSSCRSRQQGAGIKRCGRGTGTIHRDGGYLPENGLEGELDEELGYSKYDYATRMPTTARTDTSKRGERDVAVPRGRKGAFDPQWVKKNQTILSGDIEAVGEHLYGSSWKSHVRSEGRIVKAVNIAVMPRQMHRPRCMKWMHLKISGAANTPGSGNPGGSTGTLQRNGR